MMCVGIYGILHALNEIGFEDFYNPSFKAQKFIHT